MSHPNRKLAVQAHEGRARYRRHLEIQAYVHCLHLSKDDDHVEMPALLLAFSPWLALDTSYGVRRLKLYPNSCVALLPPFSTKGVSAALAFLNTSVMHVSEGDPEDAFLCPQSHVQVACRVIASVSVRRWLLAQF